MKTIQEQITDLENTRAAKAARMTEVMQKSLDEGRSTDPAEAEEFDTIESDLKTIDADLVRLKKLEKLNLEKAVPAAGFKTVEASESRAGVGVSVKNTQKLDPGIEFARYAMCLIAAKGAPDQALRMARTHYSNQERVIKAIELQCDRGSMESIMKADVAAGTTTGATWAGPLVDYQAFAGDFVEFLRPQTILGKFGTGNIPSLNRIPFNVRINGQTSGGSGYWVGEGAPKPLTKFDFNATELRWAKVANIAVLTEETIRFSNPSAERLVRDALASALISRMDIDFVDPAKAAVANVSPASITNGVTPIASSGSDAEAIRADVRALWAPFIAASNPPTTAVYIMSATNALALSMMQNPLGQAEFPGLTMAGGTFMGVPAIVSEYLDNSGGSAGGIVILANARDIWLADDGQVNIDASREASLQMLDNPTNNSATPTPTTLVSMFQTNSVAIKCERFVNWAKRRTSAVAYLDGVSWGA